MNSRFFAATFVASDMNQPIINSKPATRMKPMSLIEIDTEMLRSPTGLDNEMRPVTAGYSTTSRIDAMRTFLPIDLIMDPACGASGSPKR